MVTTYTYGNPIEVLGISFKDTPKVFKQASFSGKCSIFYSKIFGYHHISFANLANSHEEIIYLALQYMKANE